MMSKKKQKEYEKSKYNTSKLNEKSRAFMQDIKDGKYNLQSIDENDIVFHTDLGNKVEISKVKK